VLRTLEIPTDFIRAPVEVVVQLHEMSALACAFANGKLNQRGAVLFGQLTEKHWNIVRSAQGKGEISVRELGEL
jgi:hypothetical protein